jgi:iron complex transport system ATP-binding protein
VTPLRLDHVSVVLEGALVVDGLTLSVDSGEWVGLIGPNGAGKTTVLRAAAGLAPYEGTVRLWGVELRSLRRREVARQIAVVPQDPVLPADMSVLEYVLLGRTPYVAYAGNAGARDVKAARAALERLEIAALAERRLGSLSGGERQRAVLARAVAQAPRLVLLDEPTSALDVGAQQQVLELVSALRREDGLTVVSAMHDLTLAGQYADRLALLDGGRLILGGRPRDVLTEEAVARYYGASVRVLEDGDAGIAVLPVRRAPAEQTEGASRWR